MTTELIHRENRLAKLISKPGGIDTKAAVAQAQTNLQSIAERTAQEVDLAYARLREAAARASDDVAARRQVYAEASAIAGMAAVGGLDGVGAAAYMLCELVDRYGLHGAWNDKAVQVCLESMLLLRHGSDDDGAQSILGGLGEIVRRAAPPKP
jgi:type VI protein secretion system component VasF